MRNSLATRLEHLEISLKSSGDALLFFDMKNEVVRVDIATKRGEPVKFESTLEAARWLEAKINLHENVVGSIIVDNACDLFEDSSELREIIKKVLPGEIKIRCERFSADELPVILLGRLKTEEPANLALWAIANLMRCFKTPEFRSRWLADELSDDDAILFSVVLILFSWHNPQDDIMSAFSDLFYQVTKLPAHSIEAVKVEAGDGDASRGAQA